MSKPLVAFALLMLMSAGSGCSTFTKDKGSKKSPWDSMKWWKKEYQTPTKMAVLWSPDLLTVAGQPPTRGFGGRIYFYNEKSQTIPVDGELVVHGFDETKKKMTSGQEALADKRFRFTAEQFTEHFSESDLGASYSVWIPWDSNEHTLKELTLIPTFITSKGQAIQGAPAKVILPGRNAAQPEQVIPVQTVAYEQTTIPTVEGKLPTLNLPVRDTEMLRASAASQASNTAPTNDMRVTTIKLPPGVGQAPRGKEPVNQNGMTPAGMNGAISGNAPAVNNLSPVQPYVNAQLEQMRAQAVADAFRPMGQPSGMQQQPMIQNTVPGQPGIRAPYNEVMQGAQGQGMQGQGMQGPQYQQSQGTGFPNFTNPTSRAPQAPAAGRGFKSVPTSMTSNAPYRGDDYPGELPPGFQFSPQGDAW